MFNAIRKFFTDTVEQQDDFEIQHAISHEEIKALIKSHFAPNDTDLVVNFRYGDPMFDFTASLDRKTQTQVVVPATWKFWK